MHANKDILSGVICEKCYKLLQENNFVDAFNEYIISPPGYSRLCQDCLNKKIDKIMEDQEHVDSCKSISQKNDM